MTGYEPLKSEPEILQFWHKNKIHSKSKELCKGKTRFYFLDGPPYTSGKVHLGTAWNKALKDMVLRFKRMAGYDVWDRAGFDMHGLPTEHKVQDKLNVHTKEEIKKFGMAKFSQECEKWCVEKMKDMITDFQKLGVWMDFENAYMPITHEFVDGVWWLIKKAHEQKRLYEGLRTMTWCANCETSVAKHELEYEEITDNSIYVKFQLKEKPNTYLIIWTTTPWTIPFNLLIMAHPGITYVKIKQENEQWILAKDLQKEIAPDAEIMTEFLGAELDGVSYEHPLKDVVDYSKIKAKKIHTVVMSDQYVTTAEGTGLVHCAPGCGPEDYEVGHKNELPPYNTIDERGKFTEYFTGLTARRDDEKFITILETKNAIVGKKKIKHEYPHCWRCHLPVVFRTTKQWFFMVEDLKESMIAANEKIPWVPEAGKNAFDSWLHNLRDNSISKQNIWGTPLPVWRCNSCGKYDVIQSIKELEQKSRSKVINIHKPWIDEITYACECGDLKTRIPDIIDVWVDAGSTAWNCLDYPKRTDLFEKWFPPAFILEGYDQIRGWFNLLMVCGMIALKKPAFKSVYMHGFINDAQGRKMSKSLGNYILPGEVIDKYGADTFRYYSIGSAAPGQDMIYNEKDVVLKHRNLMVLWNLHNYLTELSKEVQLPTEQVAKKIIRNEEQYILSRMHNTIKTVTELFEHNRLNEIPWIIEEFYLELSRTYVQFVREKTSGEEEQKMAVLWTLYNCMTAILKILAPVAPFITEKIYQNLKEPFKLKEESIFLHSWPSFTTAMIKPELENEITTAKEILTSVFALRDKTGLGLKWPLKEMIITSKDEKSIETARACEELLCQQANVKKTTFSTELEGLKETLKVNFGTIQRDFGKDAPKIIGKLSLETASKTILTRLNTDKKVMIDKFELKPEHFITERQIPNNLAEAEWAHGYVYINTELTKELETEGFAREITRRLQALRKKAGLQKQQVIDAHITVNKEIAESLLSHSARIAEKTGATIITINENELQYPHSEEATIRNKNFILSIKPKKLNKTEPEISAL